VPSAPRLSLAWRCGRWCRERAGLADLWVKPEVADEFARVFEAADVTDGREKARGADHVHAGDADQSLGLRPAQRIERDQAVDVSELGLEKLDLTHSRIDALTLLHRQFELAKPAPPGLAEQVADLRTCDQPPDQHGMDLVLAARASRHQLRPTCQPPAHHPGALVRHPHRVKRPGGEQPR
jgi:hypothetical protein